MRLTKYQRYFILKAIDMKECLFDFSISDKEFRLGYGRRKNEVIKELNDLRAKI